MTGALRKSKTTRQRHRKADSLGARSSLFQDKKRQHKVLDKLEKAATVGFEKHPARKVGALDGLNRAIVIAELLARVIAAIRITSVRWGSYLPLETQKSVLTDPAFVGQRFKSRDWRSFL